MDQCGDVHSTPAICENMVHGTESTFTLSCWHCDCGGSCQHIFSPVTTWHLNSWNSLRSIRLTEVLCMVRSLSSHYRMCSSPSDRQLDRLRKAAAEMIPLSSSLDSMLSARVPNSRSQRTSIFCWSPSFVETFKFLHRVFTPSACLITFFSVKYSSRSIWCELLSFGVSCFTDVCFFPKGMNKTRQHYSWTAFYHIFINLLIGVVIVTWA